MSNTTRSPLLRDKSIESMARNSSDAIVSATIMDSNFDDRVSEAFRTGEEVGRNVRRFYEAARAKDAELIQHLLDAMSALLTNEDLWALAVLDCRRAKNAAAAAGFKPAEP